MNDKYTIEFDLTIILEFENNKILKYHWKNLNQKQQQWFFILYKYCNIDDIQNLNLENAIINNSNINKLKKDLDILKIIVNKNCPEQLKETQTSIIKLTDLINKQSKKIIELEKQVKEIKKLKEQIEILTKRN
ncbi:hypothetical protein [Spiroplasma culicicola]|uniref:Uncharacterized protein n=1 Tax=Spiroplasma culicicola AES-1 TaxID=1276246 RepID=W6A7C5_9MOLU|nr:hypothetical protein [Spiroplasma culicicola]AHI53048.1 hypothetical protein SCULI_v1c07070 [Spiroplasma culicicola AES-1]